MVFLGTSVAAGTAQAVVVATAMKTELGRIAGLMEDTPADQDTPLQRKLDSFGRILVWSALGIVALLFGLGLLRGTELLELFLTSISLAVAAVPEGLPAVVTVALSLGVRRMAGRRALMRKLAAVETLGSTSVICTDKTGTLTFGEMTARAALRRRPALRGDGRRVRTGGRGALRGEESGLARTSRHCSNSRRSSSAATTRISFRRMGVGEQSAILPKAHYLWRAQRPGATETSSRRNCQSNRRFPSIPTANGAR